MRYAGFYGFVFSFGGFFALIKWSEWSIFLALRAESIQFYEFYTVVRPHSHSIIITLLTAQPIPVDTSDGYRRDLPLSDHWYMLLIQ